MAREASRVIASKVILQAVPRSPLDVNFICDTSEYQKVQIVTDESTIIGFNLSGNYATRIFIFM